MSKRATVIAVSGFLGLSVLGMRGQQTAQSPPTFRAGINYVELPVRITDRQGTFVRDLKQADFQVYEDGSRQDVASFTLVDLPIPDPKAPLLEPAKGPLADMPFVLHEGESVDGRVYLFVLDDYHILPQYSFQVKDAVQNFIKKRMGPRDIAAIVYTSVTHGQDFTRDHSALVSSLGRFRGALDAMEPGGTQMVKSVAALDKIRSMSETLGHVHGKHKALVFISPTLGCVGQRQTVGDARPEPAGARPVTGSPTYRTASPPVAIESRCFDTLWDAVRVATQANVSIYSFDPVTLGSPGWVSPSIDGRGGPDAAMQQARASEPNAVRAFDGMRVLAQETGGFTVTGANNFNKALEQIVRDHSAYYLIGYYSTNDKPDGRARKNVVTLSRPDVRVVYRPGYTAPKN